jgi:CRISPR-associated endoribonuclease Cas6/Csy4 subtype I-F
MDNTGLTHFLRIEHGRQGSRTDKVQEARAAKVFFALHLDRVNTGLAYPVGLLASRLDADALGHGIAVYGTRAELEFLLTIKSATGVTIASSGCSVSDIEPVPEDAVWINFRRFRKDKYSRSGAENVRRRRLASVEKGRITATVEDHRRHVEFLRMKDATIPRLPFLRIPSYSTRPETDAQPRNAVIYIEERLAERNAKGSFNTYGLSQDGAAVPLVA